MSGITDVKTDTSKRILTFRVTDPKLDYKAKLTDFAETNAHIKGFTIQEKAAP